MDKQFNVTHWPYIQKDDTYHCVQKFFSDSYVNESLDSAHSGIFLTALAFGMAYFSILF